MISLAISWEQIAEGTSDGKPCFGACLGCWTRVWAKGQRLLNGLAENPPNRYWTMTRLNSLFNILAVDVWQLN